MAFGSLSPTEMVLDRRMMGEGWTVEIWGNGFGPGGP